MKRRTYLSGMAAIATGAVSLTIKERMDSHTARGARSMKREPGFTLLSGTQYATPVYDIKRSNSGPTAIVVGGMHGDEHAGYRTAENVAQWSFDAGRMIVLPRANRPAIERDERHGVGGDLNRAFPPNGEPKTKLARAIWDKVVTRFEPDLLLDLHSSKGIYGVHPDFVGQSIYPTVAGDAQQHAQNTIVYLNETFVPWHMPYHDFKRGNVMDEDRPMLAHKVGGDLSKPAYIVETAKFLTDLDTRIEWTAEAARKLLSLHGIERTNNSNS